MTAKIDAPSPQRISVPEGTVLQIYSRDTYGHKCLFDLPGPLELSLVNLKRKTE
jgi:hypothetical protein